MGPAIYNCPGLTLDMLPWGKWSSLPTKPSAQRRAVLLIGGYTYDFVQWEFGVIECDKLVAGNWEEVFHTPSGDILLAQALLIELTRGKTVQDPNL